MIQAIELVTKPSQPSALISQSSYLPFCSRNGRMNTSTKARVGILFFLVTDFIRLKHALSHSNFTPRSPGSSSPFMGFINNSPAFSPRGNFLKKAMQSAFFFCDLIRLRRGLACYYLKRAHRLFCRTSLWNRGRRSRSTCSPRRCSARSLKRLH